MHRQQDMDTNKDNANPTILDASDLPARQPISTVKRRADGGTGLFDSLIPPHLSTDSDDSSSSSATSELGIDDDESEPIDTQEIFDLIAPISDPEHPLSLGSLSVIQLPDIHIKHYPSYSVVTVLITPTITHCSLATVIGLGVRVRLEQALPPRFRVDVRVKDGTHSTGDAVSKQLGDKERVAAALENGTLVGVLDKMLATCV